MKLTYFLFLISVVLTFNNPFLHGQPGKQIVGYYPNWQWYDRSQLVNPEVLLYEKYTVINYAFFRPLADGSIQSTDAWADENLLLGPMIWWPVQYHDSTRSLPYLAHQHGVKLLPSIGGWNDSYNFPQIAADPVKRQNFTNHCISLIDAYGFNGIDLDWEYPGYVPNGGTLQDKMNFTTLLQELRNAMDELENASGNEYLLTSCFGASEERMESIEWENILPLVDMVNLMTYDFHGSWEPVSNHHTPLYSPLGDPSWCIDGAFTKLTQQYGVPPEKVNIGLAFYGKALANCTELYGPHTGYDVATFSEDEGQPLYYNILKKMDMFTYHWDDQVKCPYLLGNDLNTFVTFDDSLSITYKAQYIVDNNALGVIIWEITGDYIETYPGSGEISGTPLLDNVHQVFDQSKACAIKVFLEGPFNGTDMNTSLTGQPELVEGFPLTQPYNLPPWNYEGTESIVSLPNPDIVDWVLIEFRDAPDAASATQATIIERQAALLKNDGSVVGLDGTSILSFNHVIIHSLFAVVYHRNHLAIISGYHLNETGGFYTYDFTTTPNQAFNSGQKEIASETWGMLAGDADASGSVNETDKTSVWDLQAGQSGYWDSDLNMDSQSNNMDKNDYWRPNLGESSKVPD